MNCWLRYEIEHDLRSRMNNLISRQKKSEKIQGSIPGQAWIFLRFFFIRFGCSFLYREDHVLFDKRNTLMICDCL